MTTLMLVASLVLFAAALAVCFLGYGWSAALAFVGLWMAGADTAALVGWGVCSVLVWGLSVMLPRTITGARYGVIYMFTGAVAGTVIGLMMSSAGVVIASLIGVLCGGLAYGSTPAGKQLGFPSAKYFNYLAAKGFLYVITTSIIGTGLLLIF